MCRLCRNNSYTHNNTTYVAAYNDCIIIIKNVPCIECELCGEQYFTDRVSEKIERLANSAKELMAELSVIDYAKAA